MTAQIVLDYRHSDYLGLVLDGFAFLCCIVTAVVVFRMVVVEGPPFIRFDFSERLWVVFASAIILLILNVASLILNVLFDDVLGVLLCAIVCIILALLAGSTWMVATAT